GARGGEGRRTARRRARLRRSKGREGRGPRLDPGRQLAARRHGASNARAPRALHRYRTTGSARLPSGAVLRATAPTLAAGPRGPLVAIAPFRISSASRSGSTPIRP